MNLTPNILFEIIGTLIVCLGAVLWFFFTRACKKLDDIQRGLHDIEARFNLRINEVDSRVDKTNHDLSVAFTQLGEMKGILSVIARKEWGEALSKKEWGVIASAKRNDDDEK